MSTSYILKVTLKDMPNTIWRRFVVPSDMLLDELHAVLQVVMGWYNSHLHAFVVGRQQYVPSEAMDDDDLPEEENSLADLAPKNVQRFATNMTSATVGSMRSSLKTPTTRTRIGRILCIAWKVFVPAPPKIAAELADTWISARQLRTKTTLNTVS